MYPTHAAVLHVVPRDAGEPSAHAAAMRSTVEAWLVAELRPNGGSVDRREIGRDDLRSIALRGPGRHAGEMREVGDPGADDWAWEGWIERTLPPDDHSPLARTLRTDVQLRGEHGVPGGSPRVVLTLREHLAFPDGGRSPSRQAEMAPPSSLLGTLLEEFRVYQGTIEWTRSYWTVATERQVEQLYERIVDPGRTVPLLVCVGDEQQGPPIDPAELGRALFGTARVVHIARPRLTRRLRELIGEKHRVGWNVIRLYRPRYSPADSGGVHRFFRRAEIDGYVNVPFPEWLASHLQREASYLISPDTAVRDRFRAAERRQADAALTAVDAALASLRPHLGAVEHDSLADAISLLTAELAATQDRLAEAEALAGAYDAELHQARDEIYRLKSRIGGLEEQVRGASQAGLPSETMAEPATVREAIEQVLATVIDGELVVHERVLKQAERQRLPLDPAHVRDTLLTIRDVARRCRDGHGDGRSPADYFRERGLTLKADVSETARQQYAADYTIEIDRNGTAERVLMGPHVDLSARHRIYWYHDKEAQRFIVGHIGDHLRDASTN